MVLATPIPELKSTSTFPGQAGGNIGKGAAVGGGGRFRFISGRDFGGARDEMLCTFMHLLG